MFTFMLTIFFLIFSYIALGVICVQLALQQSGKFLRLARIVLRSDFKAYTDDQVLILWQNSQTRIQNDNIYAAKCSMAWPAWFMLVLATGDKWAKRAQQAAASGTDKEKDTAKSTSTK